MLTETQLQFLQDEIDKSALSLQSLKEELLDHFCCFIEAEMEHGASFETAYLHARQEIAPNGLMEIQQETLLLLNIHKMKAMKTITYTIGLLSSMSFSTGWIFKLLQYPGANVLLYGGFLLFVLVFVPLLAYEKYKLPIQNIRSERLKILLGTASAILSGIGLFMKIMSLPGGNIVFVSGAFLFIAGFLPSLFFNIYRKSIH